MYIEASLGMADKKQDFLSGSLYEGVTWNTVTFYDMYEQDCLLNVICEGYSKSLSMKKKKE